jgi:glycosyltransferase involved in cell wall biosynthesis
VGPRSQTRQAMPWAACEEMLLRFGHRWTALKANLPEEDRASVVSPSEITLKVSAETAYPPSAPSARVRVASFAPYVARHGLGLRYRPTLTEREYAQLTSNASAVHKVGTLGRAAMRLARSARAQNDDLVLIHRLRFLSPLPGLEPSPAVDIYDFDDALFVGSILSANRRFEWLKREASRHHTYLKRARLVIAGNSYLASYARKFARRVEVVPSCVDPGAQSTHEHQPRDVVRVGWVGSRSTSSHLSEIFPLFAKLNSDRVRARLVAVGAEPSFSAPWLEFRPWSLPREREDLASFDLGIMPMPDNEWTRGKCGYKLLQYFAAGVPAIASPVGINPLLIGDERGRLAESHQDWLRALTELVEDAEARKAMGSAARSFVERDFSYRRWAPDLAALMQELYR